MATGTILDASPRGRRRPAMFRALGDSEPPTEIDVGGCRLRRVRVFKHDSWAATALYEDAGRRVVCKFNRRQPIAGLPMTWLGRRLARREARMLRLLADEPNVPADCGIVRVRGRRVLTAVAHEFVPGRPLRKDDRPDAGFFRELERLLDSVHRRNIAYVDLHKRENILVGEDGRPHLIDFQISVRLPRVWPLSYLLHVLQQSDRYHVAKHVWRLQRERSGGAIARRMQHRPWWIRVHRAVAVPFRTLRRRLLVQAGVRTGDGKAHTEHAPEFGVREAA